MRHLLIAALLATAVVPDDKPAPQPRTDVGKKRVEMPIYESVVKPRAVVVRKRDARTADADTANSKYATLGLRAIEDIMPRTPEPVEAAPARPAPEKYDLSKTGIEWHRGMDAVVHRGKPILLLQILGNFDEVYC